MEQPPILGRPGSDTPTEPPPSSAQQPSDSPRSMRGMVLATAGVAVAVLAVCNGLLLWLYQHSSLGVVVTLGTFVAGVSLAWLRNRTRQITVIVLYVQALIAVAGVTGVLIGLNSDLWTGVLSSGVTLAGLLGVSAVGLLFYTGERNPKTRIVSLTAVLAVGATMVGSYTYLLWDHHTSTQGKPFEAYPEESVYFLITDGQYYTGDPANDDPRAEEVFERSTCPANRENIAHIFRTLVKIGERRLQSTDEKIISESRSGGLHTAKVTASVTVVDDFDETVISGPKVWTFHLEKRPMERYWRVCRIERPSGP